MGPLSVRIHEHLPGWSALRDSGLHFVLSKGVPRIVAEHTPAVVRRFLGRHGLSPKELAFLVLQPGGRKVLEALESGSAGARAVPEPGFAGMAALHVAVLASALLETFVFRRSVPSWFGAAAALGVVGAGVLRVSAIRMTRSSKSAWRRTPAIVSNES